MHLYYANLHTMPCLVNDGGFLPLMLPYPLPRNLGILVLSVFQIGLCVCSIDQILRSQLLPIPLLYRASLTVIAWASSLCATCCTFKNLCCP